MLMCKLCFRAEMRQTNKNAQREQSLGPGPVWLHIHATRPSPPPLRVAWSCPDDSILVGDGAWPTGSTSRRWGGGRMGQAKVFPLFLPWVVSLLQLQFCHGSSASPKRPAVVSVLTLCYSPCSPATALSWPCPPAQGCHI